MRITTLVICSLFVLACGGGGSGDDADASTPTPPMVATTMPATDAADVAIDTQVSVSFTSAVNAATLSQSSFTLEDADGNHVTAMVNANPMGATLIPNSPLLGGITYTARLSTAVTGSDGTPLASAYSWQFTIRPVAWHPGIKLENDDTGDAQSPVIATDAFGNMLAIWKQWDGSQFSVWAARFTLASGWGAPELIENEDGEAQFLRLAMCPSGEALAVFTIGELGNNSDLWSSHYDPSNGWQAAQPIETATGPSLSPAVVCDSPDNFTIAWVQDDGPYKNLWSRRDTPSEWTLAELLETADGNVQLPRMVVNADGTVLVVWQQNDGTRNNIMANWFDPASGWGTAEAVETETGEAKQPVVALDPMGNATVVWRQYEDTPMLYNMWAARYTPGTGWGTAQAIETASEADTGWPEVTADPDGNVIAVWDESSNGVRSIWANRYVVGSGWGTATLLENNDVNYALDQRVATDPAGNAIVVWYQGSNSIFNIWASQFSPDNGWSERTIIGVMDRGLAAEPRIAIDPFGRANVVWWENDGIRYNIWSARYD